MHVLSLKYTLHHYIYTQDNVFQWEKVKNNWSGTVWGVLERMTAHPTQTSRAQLFIHYSLQEPWATVSARKRQPSLGRIAPGRRWTKTDRELLCLRIFCTWFFSSWFFSTNNSCFQEGFSCNNCGCCFFSYKTSSLDESVRYMNKIEMFAQVYFFDSVYISSNFMEPVEAMVSNACQSWALLYQYL